MTHGTLVQRQISNFNSHAHVERDRILAVLPADFVDFNSHAHVERDARVAEFFNATLNFNSHAHVERDLAKFKLIS